MNHIAPLHEPLIREVPLSRLALAPENVRKTPADPVAEAEIKASIATHGLLENLVVRMDGPADAGAYAVIAGGRRLAAMKALAEDGTIDADHPVPCLVATDPAMASELSLAENIVRIAMHPADQVIAFTKLADAGLSVGSIAARFGTAERLVEQRLCQRRLKIRPRGGAKDCHLGWWAELGVRLGFGDAFRGFFGGSGQRSHAELKRPAPAGRPQGGMVCRVGVSLATRALEARCRPGPIGGAPEFSYRRCFCGRGSG